MPKETSLASWCVLPVSFSLRVTGAPQTQIYFSCFNYTHRNFHTLYSMLRTTDSAHEGDWQDAQHMTAAQQQKTIHSDCSATAAPSVLFWPPSPSGVMSDDVYTLTAAAAKTWQDLRCTEGPQSTYTTSQPQGQMKEFRPHGDCLPSWKHDGWL
jgi:hypothetical protein